MHCFVVAGIFVYFFIIFFLILGGVYAALYMVPGVSDWRRAKVMARVTIPRSKTVYFKVLFIDYGNTKLVSYPNMKPLDPRSLKENLNATECSLLNLDIENLERDSHLQFAEIIHEKELYLKYFDREDVCGPREVDIYIPTISGNLVSVRDLLTKNTDLTPTLVILKKCLLEKCCELTSLRFVRLRQKINTTYLYNLHRLIARESQIIKMCFLCCKMVFYHTRAVRYNWLKNNCYGQLGEKKNFTHG